MLLFAFTFFFLIPYAHNQYLKISFKEKIWVHRVNTIERFLSVADQFKGVEIDLVFKSDSNYFDVNHPPEKSIHLSLYRLLKTKNDCSHLRLWLDFKNLKASNAEASLKRLEAISKSLNINPNQIIVESRKPLFLKGFRAKGFKTSYYLPADIATLNKKKLREQIELIRDLKRTESIDFISSNIRDYAFLKQHFPDCQIITWAGKSIHKIDVFYAFKIMLHEHIYPALRDDNVKVILFK